MEYLLALIRVIGLLATYIIFGLIGFVLFITLYLSKKTRYRTVVFFIRLWAKCSCLLLNIKIHRADKIKVFPGSLLISNHVGMPDIFVMGSCFPAFFVSKAEISRWPFINLLVKFGATIFVDRRRKQQVPSTINQIIERLQSGCSVVIFPESTATDGSSILPFKSSYFEASIATGQPAVPIVIKYQDQNSPSVACWYRINFITHLIRLLKCRRLDVLVEVLPFFKSESNRRVLARKCHDSIRQKFLP